MEANPVIIAPELGPNFSQKRDSGMEIESIFLCREQYSMRRNGVVINIREKFRQDSAADEVMRINFETINLGKTFYFPRFKFPSLISQRDAHQPMNSGIDRCVLMSSRMKQRFIWIETPEKELFLCMLNDARKTSLCCIQEICRSKNAILSHLMSIVKKVYRL